MLLVLMALAVTACSDSEPLPDIDATVEASVKRAIASLVVPTLAPLPTYTPMPTYTPVPRVIPGVSQALNRSLRNGHNSFV